MAKLIIKGVRPDKPDKKVGAVIAKKYGLPKDRILPIGNISFNGDGFDRNMFLTNTSQANDSLLLLQKCMDGKTIVDFQKINF